MTAYAPAPDPTAVMGRRYGAYIVDTIIGFIIAIAAFAATVDYDTLSEADSLQLFGEANLCNAVITDSFDDTDSSAEFDLCSATLTFPSGEEFADRIIIYNGTENLVFSFGDTALLWLITVGYSILVYWILQGLTGATPGKALFGIRTVNAEGSRPGIGRAALRTILLIVDTIGCCVPLVGPIVAGVSKGHRRVGDMAAKTFVVGKDSVGQPVVVPGLTPPGVGGGGYPPPGGYPPASGFPPATGFPAAAGFPPADQPPASTPPADTDIGWGAPTPSTDSAMGVSSGEATPSTAAAAGEPQWDAARNAYIQWDAAQQTWLQFDDATQQWRPIQ